MDIGDIAGVDRALAARLNQDGWTVSRLATTTPPYLMKYPGVKMDTARLIIDGARALINRQGEKEARPRPVAAPTVYVSPPLSAPERVSARVRRIQERMR